LSDGEWTAVLYAVAVGQVQHLVRRLAIADGYLPIEPCPKCGNLPEAAVDGTRPPAADERATGLGTAKEA
jgi:hypothetical protein